MRFHLIHEPDGGRIGYQKICKKDGEPVPDDEIVKGFEFEKDEFVDAMEQAGLAAIAKFVMRDRQHVGCLRVREGALTLEQMFFHDEVRPLHEIAPGKVKVPKSELDLAAALIEQFSGSFEPTRYEDTYREALCDVIRAKRKGKTVTAPEPEAEEEPADLMAALRASVEAAKKRSPAGSARKTSQKRSSPARRPGSRKKKAAAKKR